MPYLLVFFGVFTVPAAIAEGNVMALLFVGIVTTVALVIGE